MGRISASKLQVPPVVRGLEAIFTGLPDEELLTKLRGPRRRGRQDTTLKNSGAATWPTTYWGSNPYPRSFACSTTTSTSPAPAASTRPKKPPDQSTFSRFGSKLASSDFILAVKNVLRGLTRQCFEEFPDFGKSVAIDSTDINAWSNGGKIRHKGVRGPYRRGITSDPDARSVVKTNTEGRKKYVGSTGFTYGHTPNTSLLSFVDISNGNVADMKKATPLQQEDFWPPAI